MVIYKITCEKDRRFYIGASTSPHNRRLEHFNHLRKNKHHNIFLQRAFNKYGEESFTYEVLESFEDEEVMWRREEELIEALTNTYNMMPGGIRGPRLFGKDNPKYGKPISEQQRKLQSEAMSGEKHPFYGKKRPEHSELLRRNNPMHTHSIDFSGEKNPNAKHFADYEAITRLREDKKTWNEIATELSKKSAEALRRSYKTYLKNKN
jgi:group I intron endonuclease